MTALAAPVVPLTPGALDTVLDDPLETDPCTRWSLTPGGTRVGETCLQLSGLYCAACAGTIEATLRQQPGVVAASVAAATRRATVVWDPSRARLSELISALRTAGYGAVPDAAAPARDLRRREHRTALWRLFVASFCAMQVMMLATPSYVAAPGDLSADMRALLNWGGWVLSLPVMGFSAGPFFKAAWAQLRRGRIGMDTPVALALVVTFIASMGATFDPQGVFGREVYFDSLTMFLSFLLAGRFLEMRVRHSAAEDLERALARLPQSCERRDPRGRWERVSVRRLEPGDVVRVPVGQAIPADGVVLQGRGAIDESLLTGESIPVVRAPGDEVVAASINVGAPIVMQVVRVGADTRYDAIVSMMRQAMSQRPGAARLADRWAAPFLWAVLLLAAAGALAWWILEPSRALWVAVSVLVVTCPCAFSLAAPASLVAAAGGLAKRGVIFKRLEAVEQLAAAQRIVFDKTGTLTEGDVELATIEVVPGAPIPPAEAHRIAASLAGWSTHPLSRAIAKSLTQVPDESQWSDVSEQPGQGLQAVDRRGRHFRLGAWTWVTEAGVEAPAVARVWLSCDGEACVGFQFDEVLRPGAREALDALQALGLRLTLLTGDGEESAHRAAARLGIGEVRAQASPEDKLAWVTAAQARGERVVMVGDGINDAPVLARADVALAMGQGALLARTQADAVLASNRPSDLLLAVTAARKTMRIVRQNLIWAAAYNLACIPLALAGWLPPWAAGLGMAGSSLAVIANSMRAARS